MGHRRRRRWAWAIGVAGVGYVLYKLVNKVPQAVTAAASAATNAVSQTIANTWLSLPVIGLGQGITILGNMKLPDGTLVPMQSLVGNLRQAQDTTDTYASYAGNLYQLSPSDAQGNYPATLLGPTPVGA